MSIPALLSSPNVETVYNDTIIILFSFCLLFSSSLLFLLLFFSLVIVTVLHIHSNSDMLVH